MVFAVKLPPEIAPPPDPNCRPPEGTFSRAPFLINASLGASEKLTHALAAENIGEDKVFVSIPGLKALDLISVIGSKSASGRYRHAVLLDVNERQIQAMTEVLALIEKNDTPSKFMKDFKDVYSRYAKPPEWMTNDEKLAYDNVFGASYQPPPSRLGEYFQRVAPSKVALNKLEKSLADDNYHRNSRLPQPKPDEVVGQEVAARMAQIVAQHQKSWLAPENYHAIRAMVKEKRIALALLDLRDEDKVKVLKGWLAGQGLKTGHMYLSSSIDFADPSLQMDYYGHERHEGYAVQETDKFFRNLQTLSHPDTRFIISEAVNDVSILQPSSIAALAEIPVPEGVKDFPDLRLQMFQLYQMREINQEQLEQISLGRKEEPSWDKKTYQVVFHAGGKAWRLASFTDESVGSYYRIFPERPVRRIEEERFREQIDKMNEWLSAKANATKIVPNVNVPELAVDEMFFSEQYNSKEAAKERQYHDPYMQLSTKPFKLMQDRGPVILRELVHQLKSILNHSPEHGR